MANTVSADRRSVIGTPKNFWLHTPKDGFDLTHPPSPSSPPITPRVKTQTTTSPITIDPAKSALVVVDMQNFFLSPAFGRNTEGSGHKACTQLITNAIPACRKSGIRVIWMNWGLTEDDLSTMPPAVKRAFGFEAVPDEAKSDGEGDTHLFEESPSGIPVDKMGEVRFQGGHVLLENGKDGRIYKGLGSPCGEVIDPESGKKIDAGRLLMRDSWNAALYPPLEKLFIEGEKLQNRPDVWVHKNRMSGLWGASTLLEDFLEKEGIRSLFFSGVNTDQCVSGTLTDAFSKGYDCVLLSDGCGTTSPESSQQCIEYNAAKTWGFLTSCASLAEAVEGIEG
ncbi:isochorismatase family protein [Aulographum hederae CBS 113979]|uniref:Isochorismatase family protein n=1 Tax=Aulographum hederae CBS 113979 TaxID=1176131 RepID=A0A6G1H4F4_9PEZI|nr:isochorismatase family protein [Aulographum hederae CBS 113979]